MVDALRRAQEIVTAAGCIVDLHPTARSARVEVGTRATGRIDDGDARHRHAAASMALAAAVDTGLLIVESAAEFTFYTYGDSLEELAAYLTSHWKSARIGEATARQTRKALRARPREKLRIREQVAITRLRPS
jgi:hypothetical protein